MDNVGYQHHSSASPACLQRLHWTLKLKWMPSCAFSGCISIVSLVDGFLVGSRIVLRWCQVLYNHHMLLWIKSFFSLMMAMSESPRLFITHHFHETTTTHNHLRLFPVLSWCHPGIFLASFENTSSYFFSWEQFLLLSKSVTVLSNGVLTSTNYSCIFPIIFTMKSTRNLLFDSWNI